jgi:cysteinyl-tRNA synthetase
MQAGARVEVKGEKRHPADFALWKKAEAGHIMQWPSPWGMGYPGWHIECTVMGQKYLGETLDIHGGGLENQFPHHEDEIAQAEAATGKPFVRYWLHNNMVTVDGQKMGKSLGNFITLRDAFGARAPMVIRMFVLQSHYRSPLDFSDEALDAAERGYERLVGAASAVRKALAAAEGEAAGKVREAVDAVRRRFGEAMDDDFNTPVALATLFDLAREANRLASEGGATKGSLECVASAFGELGGEVLGLDLEAEEAGGREGLAADLVEAMIEVRAQAREAKDFAKADAIRDRLAEAGVVLEDGPEGTTWRVK